MSAEPGFLKEKGQEVPPEKCFVGFDAYQKVIDSGVDIILDATPPYFRPLHLGGCNSGQENMLLSKNRSVLTRLVPGQSWQRPGKPKVWICVSLPGTHYRHQRDPVANWYQVKNGAIGEIVSGNIYFNMGKLWHRDPDPEWSEMEYMIRNWVNWCWLSGDHIVEQHVHNIDLMNWFTGSHPVRATGFGSRQRRIPAISMIISVWILFSKTECISTVCAARSMDAQIISLTGYREQRAQPTDRENR